MKEGWLKDEYLIPFDGSEADAAADRYGIASELPGFSLVGLRGWDDFLVRDENGRVFTVPTVPLDAGLLAPFQLPPADTWLEQDIQYAGKIKWYVQPLVFGGDPTIGDNLTWVSHELHAQLVRWWNRLYRYHRPNEQLSGFRPTS
jgi:hypothetical protein